SEAATFHCNSVNVHAVKVRAIMDTAKLKDYFIQQIKEFDPTWILISSEDAGHVLLEAAIKTAPAKVVYLARTTIWLPFGPDCYHDDPAKTELLRKAAGIMVVGAYLKDYFWKWAKLKSEVLPISLFGAGPFPDFGNFEQGYVTMVNPCGYKGISIFLELARLFPEIEFAAIPTWGTTSADLNSLMKLKNIQIIEPVDDMNKVYRKTRIMIVPSLWAEAKSRTIVEAMVHGIPVLASNVGGNPEAKLGVEYVLPVNPIQGYQQLCDERSLPISEIPPQDIRPWSEALHRLLTEREHYRDVSERSRKAALDYLERRGGAERVEEYLLNLKVAAVDSENSGSDTGKEDLISKLTPAQKRLLALRLNKNK
ncbi:MAG TPA: glycosyltransferase, partial [Bacillota bacterium]|nr:glycosyltransferase [Bacillota bacterium]